MIALDVNVLVYAMRSDLPEHQRIQHRVFRVKRFTVQHATSREDEKREQEKLKRRSVTSPGNTDEVKLVPTGGLPWKLRRPEIWTSKRRLDYPGVQLSPLAVRRDSASDKWFDRVQII